MAQFLTREILWAVPIGLVSVLIGSPQLFYGYLIVNALLVANRRG